MPSQVRGHAIREGTRALTTLVNSAFVIWEFLITFANEVDIFWRKQATATSLLFVVTRWSMVLNVLLEFVPVTETTYEFTSSTHVLLPSIDIFLQ